jgi:amino acid adenylation domain-containing protein
MTTLPASVPISCAADYLTGALSAAEFQRIVLDWNATDHHLDPPAYLPDLVEQQAAIRPEAVAVVGEDGSLTYAELDAQANGLASRLIALGARPEDLVGIYLRRSARMLVAILGVLKASCAYLPLDEELPTARIEYMLSDADAAIVITEQDLAERLQARQTVCLDTEQAELGRQRLAPPARALRGHSLAYVIYTSGSTGAPKAVMIEHAGVVNLARWHARTFGVTAGDRATITARLGFDATVWEMWPYLSCGASLYMAPELGRLAPAEVRDWLCQHRITMSWLPPSLIEPLLDLSWPPDMSLRVLFAGSDRLSARPPVGFPARVVNVYGPTESTVISTFADIADRTVASSLPAIGRPLDNHRCYVLDEGLLPVPVGTPGELYLGGIGLARGYLGSPDLTASRFVPDPFSGKEGARLYRTGDLVVHQDDGNLAFIGRQDDQVKIRGYRVELAEVGLAIRNYPGIGSAEVIAADADGVRSLVAFYTSDAAIPEAQLRSFIAARLPHYMIPARFAALDALPVTSNRKVDRARLTQLAEALPIRPALNPPVTDTERMIAGLWCRVLGTEQVDIETSFADLGGNSLLAMRVHGDLVKRYPGRLRLVDLFRYGTVRELARFLDTGEAARPSAGGRRGAQRRAAQTGHRATAARADQRRIARSDGDST